MTENLNPFESERPTGRALISAEGERAGAEIKAALVVARANPRVPLKCMDLILQDCTRPKLAEKANYEYVRGGSEISGPSIVLAEALARRWGNLEAGVRELSRADGYSECESYCWDYETNYREKRTFYVPHWRDTKSGGYAISDARDIYEAIANVGARRKRACILAVIPPDVVEVAQKQIAITLKQHFQVTSERIKEMLDRFAEYKVTRAMIEARIQRRLDAVTSALLAQLGRIYNSLRDGMAQAGDFFEITASEPEITMPKAKSAPAAAQDPAHKLSPWELGMAGTGPSPAATEAPPPFTPEQIAQQIAQAKTPEALDETTDLIGSIPEEAERAKLVTLAKEARTKLEASAAATGLTAGQQKVLREKLTQAGKSPDEFAAHFGCDVEQLAPERFKEAVAWVKDQRSA